MAFFKEFKEFATRGNVVDLSVGVIIGAAFGKVVSSVVADLIMPPIGLLIGGVNFTDIKLPLKQAVLDPAGKVLSPQVTLNIGNFIQTLVDFTIVAFAIFLMVKVINIVRKRLEAEAAAAPAPEPSQQERLLMEIRDLLKK